jgi:hypothetical protein
MPGLLAIYDNLKHTNFYRYALSRCRYVSCSGAGVTENNLKFDLF